MSKKTQADKMKRKQRKVQKISAKTQARIDEAQARLDEIEQLHSQGAFDPKPLPKLKAGEAGVIAYVTLDGNVWIASVLFDGVARILPVANHGGQKEFAEQIAEFCKRKGARSIQIQEQLTPLHDDEVNDDEYRMFSEMLEQSVAQHPGSKLVHTSDALEQWN